jgi:glycosyltransferase involved in cell wall biosynthesis
VGAVLKTLFWGSLGALAWTHVGYPATAGLVARVRPRAVAKDDTFEPTVSVVIAAHDEEDVIEARLENLLALDYPMDRFDIVVASDASTDRTDDLVEAIAAREPRVRLLACERAGKVAAQHCAVRDTTGEVVAFSDANSTWAPDVLRLLTASLADPEVGYVCGRLELRDATGANKEGLYWRYELWLRQQESLVHSITGGNGAVYAVRRADYVEDDPRYGHDLGFPYLMVQHGKRAVYEPAAVAMESASSEPEDEYERKVRMVAQSWGHVLTGRMLRRTNPIYMVELVSHRLLRYGSGILHIALFASNVALVPRGGTVYRVAFAGQLATLGLVYAGKRRAKVPGAGIAYYYFLVTRATFDGLVRYVRRGTPVVWGKADGTR